MSDVGKDKEETKQEIKTSSQAKSESREKTRKAEPSFWDKLKSEYAKIIWPNREVLVKQTIAVSVCSLVLGVLIACIDFLFKMGFGFVIK